MKSTIIRTDYYYGIITKEERRRFDKYKIYWLDQNDITIQYVDKITLKKWIKEGDIYLITKKIW